MSIFDSVDCCDIWYCVIFFSLFRPKIDVITKEIHTVSEGYLVFLFLNFELNQRVNSFKISNLLSELPYGQGVSLCAYVLI